MDRIYRIFQDLQDFLNQVMLSNTVLCPLYTLILKIFLHPVDPVHCSCCLAFTLHR